MQAILHEPHNSWESSGPIEGWCSYFWVTAAGVKRVENRRLTIYRGTLVIHARRSIDPAGVGRIARIDHNLIVEP